MAAKSDAPLSASKNIPSVPLHHSNDTGKRRLTATKVQLLTSHTPPFKPSSDRRPETSHAQSNNQRRVRTETALMPFEVSTPSYIENPNTARTHCTTPNKKQRVDKTPRIPSQRTTPSQRQQSPMISPLVFAKVPFQGNDSNDAHNKTATLLVVTHIPLDKQSTFIVRLFAMIHHSHQVSPDVCRWVQDGTAISKTVLQSSSNPLMETRDSCR